MTNIVLACHGLQKHYTQGPQQLPVLQGIELQVQQGERLAILGASGSGKSTLLNMLGGLDLPSAGKVEIQQREIASMSDADRSEWRNRQLGFVYQFHHLLPEFTALENVAMPLLIRGEPKAKIIKAASTILQRVGLAERLQHKPAELSGGERQRVAIARALVAEPACVLMDEPTGNLDAQTAGSIQNLILELNQSLATSFIIVTHDMAMASQMSRCLELRDGRLYEKSV